MCEQDGGAGRRMSRGTESGRRSPRAGCGGSLGGGCPDGGWRGAGLPADALAGVGRRPDGRIQAGTSVGARWIVAVLVALVALPVVGAAHGAPAAADPVPMLVVEHAAVIDDALLRAVADGLSRSGLTALPARWDRELPELARAAVDGETWWSRAVEPLARAREAYWAGSFEESVRMLEPWLVMIGQRQAELAAEPGLVPLVVDAMLLLIDALELQGRSAERERVLERIARALPWGTPSGAESPPGAWADLVAAQAAVRSRRVAVVVRPAGARLEVNGSAVTLDAEGAIAAPGTGGVWLRARHGGRHSRLWWLADGRDAAWFDLDVDEALRHHDGEVRLMARSVDTNAEWGRALELLGVWTGRDWLAVAQVEAGQASSLALVELMGRRNDGRIRSVRGARIADWDAERWAAVKDWLLGEGAAPAGLDVREGHGHWPVVGSALQVSFGDRGQGRRRSGWVLTAGGGAAAIAALGVGLSRQQRAGALERCSSSEPLSCRGTAEVERLRSELRARHAALWTLAAFSGAALTGGVVLLSGDADEARARSLELELGPGRVSARAGLRF